MLVARDALWARKQWRRRNDALVLLSTKFNKKRVGVIQEVLNNNNNLRVFISLQLERKCSNDKDKNESIHLFE